MPDAPPSPSPRGPAGTADSKPAVAGPSWLSQLFFVFAAKPISIARAKGALEKADLPSSLEGQVRTRPLYDRYEDAWLHQKTRSKPRMVLAIASGHWYRLAFTAVLYLISQGSTLAGPLLINKIVSGLSCRQYDPDISTCPSQRSLYLYAGGLFIAPLVQAFAENTMNYQLNLIGLACRNALMAAIFRKCLRLNTASLASESLGRIVTLMSNDAQKVQDATVAVNTLWGSPIFIIVVMVLLYGQIKWACFVGLALILALAPITGTVAKKLAMLRRSTVKWTDKRTSIMSELINGMRVVKFYAWEAPFKDIVQSFRSQEASILRKVANLQGVFGMVLFAGPQFVGIVSFAVYALAGNKLTAAAAFTSLALFTLLRFPMSFLPIFITQAVNANVALTRIRLFLERGEVEDEDPDFDTDVKPGHVSIKGGNFAWGDNPEELTLMDVNMECPPGSLTMIVGSVGSGKSSVLGALTRQIGRTSGTVALGGSLAYVPQVAWIMNATVRDNVLMGLPMEQTRYLTALRTAQLETDLEQMADGDLTEIGERGITLSGGQKQRLSIARAVYADADVVLMDDPLSAVDAHVGKALFEQCIQGSLKGKTVVLVTNALHFVHYADHVVWLQDGVIRGTGTYDELDKDPAFSELISSHVIPEEANKADEEDGDVKGAAGPAAGDDAKKEQAIKAVNERNLTGNEDRPKGAVGLHVLARYTLAGGGTLWVTAVLLMYTLEQGTKIFTDTWLSFWVGDKFKESLTFYLLIYASLGLAFGLVTYIRAITFVFGTVRAAVNLHNDLLDKILRLPMSFFDTNPSGRVINRFSRDTDIMDSTLPTSLVQFGACVSNFLGILVVISFVTPVFLAFLPPVIIIYFYIQRYYIPGARELQRYEAITRSPIYTGFSEALNGIATIRAYKRTDFFVDMSDERIQTNAIVFLTQRAAAAWLSIRLDFLGLFVITAAGMLAVAGVTGSVNPGLAGLSLTYALDLTKFLKFGTQMASKTEADFNSAERVVQYLDEDPEAPAHVPEVDSTLQNWPSVGGVVVEQAIMRYRPTLPQVLKGVSFDVLPEEKVGFVGRTGSGKSSLFLAFFRMVELEGGRICIDGVDIRTLGLHVLRSRLSMIPQDPFMFSGTVRLNLDPFSEYNDLQVWQALGDVGLREKVQSLEGGLEAVVTDNGSNFSQGQRQLVCLARALLRNSKILMMDEATASVDMDTDLLIQRTVRSNFQHCTVLTIAHRLNTIMDSDRVLVMDAGLAAEYGPPDELLAARGMLSALVENTGKKSAAFLRQVATQASLKRAQSKGQLTAGLPDDVPQALNNSSGTVTVTSGNSGPCDDVERSAPETPASVAERVVPGGVDDKA